MQTEKLTMPRKIGSRNAKWGYIFLVPWFLFFSIFMLFPFIFGIGVSFTDYDLSGMHFIGLENFKAIPLDLAFSRSVTATFAYGFLTLPLNIALSLWIANTLQQHTARLNAFTKLAFYLPGIVCQTAMVVIYKFVLSPSYGLIANIFHLLGLRQFSLLDQPSTAIPTLSAVIVLANLGQNIILYSAAMNGIPVSYYEVASLDGATRRQQFFGITLPLLKATTLYIVVTGTIGTMQIFAIPYLMTGGGPQYTTSTLLMMIYKSAFQNGNFGYASAVGVVLFVFTCGIAAVQFRLMKTDSVEY